MVSIGKNAAYNFFGAGVAIAVLLFATPVYVRFLGLDQFGIFTLIVSITAPLGILNAGISQSVTKFVAQHIASGNRESAGLAVQTSAFLNLCFGVCGWAVLTVLAPWLATVVFKIPYELHLTAIYAFRLAGVIWFATQIGLTYQAVLTGMQRFDRLALHNILQPLLTYGGGAVAIIAWPSVISALLVSLAVTLAYILIWSIEAKRSLVGISLLPRWKDSQARETWAFSSWQILNTTVTLLAAHADRLLLGTLKGTGLVGLYGIAMSIQARLVSLIWSLLGTLFPATSAASNKEEQSELLILRYGWVFSLMGVVLYGGVFILGSDFLILWLGADVANRAAPVLRVLMLVAFLGLPSAVLYHYFLGHGLTKWLSISNLGTSIATMVLAWVLIKRFGLLGAAWSGAVALLLTRPVFHAWVFKRRFDFGAGACSHLWKLYSLQFSGAVGIGLSLYIFDQSKTFLPNPYLQFAYGCLLAPTVTGTVAVIIESFIFKRTIPLKAVVYRLLSRTSVPRELMTQK